MKRQSIRITVSLAVIMGIVFFIWQSATSLLPPPETLSITDAPLKKAQILDRHGLPLTITYRNDWNIHDQVSLHEIPEQLQQVFIIAEDKRFFEHPGPDWYARIHAMMQNILALRIVRGASTITEQSVRMIHIRPRTFWSRWLEGFEATSFEAQFSKADILEFYLNQIPYASRRRGVVQAARYYFARSLDTLNLKEMMALAVLVRAPSRLDLWQSTTAIESSIQRLAQRLLEEQLITQEQYHSALATPLRVREFELPVQATHFVSHIYAQTPQTKRITTTLDNRLQHTVQKLLDRQLATLATQNVQNGGVLVVDHLNHNEVLAWVNGGNTIEVPSAQIDAVTTPRQPGSTLKPFLYALALEKAWSAATLIDDTPLTRPVGTGIHRYRNYSHAYHGPLRLREALGNSLNIPAIRTIQFVGVNTFLQRLHQLGFTSLTELADFYGEGLALGNGEVTLHALVQAYTALAHQGLLRPLTLTQQPQTQRGQNIMTPEVSSLIGHILSDPQARRLEFGRSNVLDLPVQTAVKTGTSTDYRDAWAIGFNYRYTVGVWLGNLDQQPMHTVSGASGAGLILRAVFAELNRYQDTQRLYLSSKLKPLPICRDNGQAANDDCPSQIEWFIAGTAPNQPSPQTTTLASAIELKQPTPGLQLAVDPRIPDAQEAFAFTLSQPLAQNQRVEWLVDGQVKATTVADNSVPQFLWPMQRGTHVAQARIWPPKAHQPITTPAVTFYVK